MTAAEQEQATALQETAAEEGETEESQTAASQPAESATQESEQEQEPTQPDFKIIIAVYGDNALAGFQQKDSDPHIEVIESNDPMEILAVIPEIHQRAQDRWGRSPKNRQHNRTKTSRSQTASKVGQPAADAQAPAKPKTRTVQTEPETQTALKLF